MELTQCQGCGNQISYCGCDEARFEHCTHPNQAWCDCDWCRVWRGYRAASKLGGCATTPMLVTLKDGSQHTMCAKCDAAWVANWSEVASTEVN